MQVSTTSHALSVSFPLVLLIASKKYHGMIQQLDMLLSYFTYQKSPKVRSTQNKLIKPVSRHHLSAVQSQVEALVASCRHHLGESTVVLLIDVGAREQNYRT